RSAIDTLPPSVRSRILMLGRVTDADLASLYAAADVFVAAATGGEGFGLVLLEAMAAGWPIVATDIPGYREVIRADVDALVGPRNDAPSLAETVRRILESPALAARLRRSARDRVRHFDWERVTDAIEHTYRVATDPDARSVSTPIADMDWSL